MNPNEPNNNKSSILNNQISIGEEKSEAIAHKNNALRELDSSFTKHIELHEYKKSNILAYWIEDFSHYHDNERTFDPHSLKRYKRGEIIKVNLGFNVGNELGGLHYCVVINKTDNLSYGTLNVIPLSSIKPNKVYSTYDINLGSELYNLLSTKFSNKLDMVKRKLLETSKLDLHDEASIKLSSELNSELISLQKLASEIQKMKEGSIAKVTQITTISKQRIYNPKNKKDILSGIKLSNDCMDLIDNKIKELFTK